MTGRRPFLSVIAAALLTGPTAPRAQIAGRVYRLGILRPTGPAPLDVNIPEALRNRGYVEGKNIVIDPSKFELVIGAAASRRGDRVTRRPRRRRVAA